MLTKPECRVLSVLLDIASDKLSNHCCTDLPDEVTDALSGDEKLALIKEYAAWSNDPDDFTSEPTAKRFDCLPDWLLMRFFRDKLDQMAQ